MVLDVELQLQYLQALIKEGNYTRAAKELYISQPYLTQVVQRIEKQLKVKILSRQAGKIILTDAGQIYFHYLEDQLLAKQQLQHQLAQFSQSKQQIIHLGILESLGSYLLPQILPEYSRQHPETKVILSEHRLAENEQRVLDGTIDFCIGQLPLTQTAGLTVHTSGREQYFFLVPAEIREERIKVLLKYPLVLTAPGSSIRSQVDSLLKRYRIRPRVRLETHSIITAVRLAEKGYGLTIAPNSVVSYLQTRHVRLLPIPLRQLDLRYFIAYRADRTLRQGEQDLIRTFQKFSPVMGK